MEIKEIVDAVVADRERISRQEMSQILQLLADNGWPIAENPYVNVTDKKAPEHWASMVKGITVVCCDHSLRDGCLRYDQPGTMHPMQHCALMFVSSDLEGHEYDQVGQMRERCDQLLIVESENPRIDN